MFCILYQHIEPNLKRQSRFAKNLYSFNINHCLNVAATCFSYSSFSPTQKFNALCPSVTAKASPFWHSKWLWYTLKLELCFVFAIGVIRLLPYSVKKLRINTLNRTYLQYTIILTITKKEIMVCIRNEQQVWMNAVVVGGLCT